MYAERQTREACAKRDKADGEDDEEYSNVASESKSSESMMEDEEDLEWNLNNSHVIQINKRIKKEIKATPNINHGKYALEEVEI